MHLATRFELPGLIRATSKGGLPDGSVGIPMPEDIPNWGVISVFDEAIGLSFSL